MARVAAWLEHRSATHSSLICTEEPHAPLIKRDDDQQQDVGGATAGPFNEGEELRLVCEVHGGLYDASGGSVV